MHVTNSFMLPIHLMCVILLLLLLLLLFKSNGLG